MSERRHERYHPPFSRQYGVGTDSMTFVHVATFMTKPGTEPARAGHRELLTEAGYRNQAG